MASLILPLASVPPSSLASRLAAAGYESVRVSAATDSVTVWYENRRRPTQLAALAEVLALTASHASGSVEIRVVPLRDDQPILTVGAAADAVLRAAGLRGPLRGQVAPPLPLPPDRALAPATDRTDVALQPAFRFDQVSYSLLGRAELASSLGSGLSLVGRLQAPLLPQFGFDPPRLAFRSSGWMAPDFPAVFQVGLDDGRPHVAGEVGYQLLRGLGFLKLKGGLSQDRFPEIVGEVDGRIPAWDLAVAGGWGQYPLGDWGPFLTITRTFPRSHVEVGVSATQYGAQFRAGLGIDLGPDPRPAPGPWRLFPGGYWKMTYLATGYAGAASIEPDPEIDAFLDRLTPAYVESHLDRLPWPEGLPAEASGPVGWTPQSR